MELKDRDAIILELYQDYYGAVELLVMAFTNQEDNIKKLYNYSLTDYMSKFSTDIYEDEMYLVELVGYMKVIENHANFSFRITNKTTRQVVGEENEKVYKTEIKMIGNWDDGFAVSGVNLHDVAVIRVVPELIETIAINLGKALTAKVNNKYSVGIGGNKLMN